MKQIEGRGPARSILEVVGPAGAGKTTIVRALLREQSGLAQRPPVRRLRTIPLVAREGARLIPSLLRSCVSGRRMPGPGHVKRMLYLQVLAALLEAPAPAGVRALILDQGPVFLLGALRGVFQDAASPGLSRWWDSALHRWARLLDRAIWLDAPDGVLIHRINARDKDHGLRGLTPQVASAALARDRETYTAVLADIAVRRPGFSVVRLDTSGPLRETASAVASLVPISRSYATTEATVNRTRRGTGR